MEKRFKDARRQVDSVWGCLQGYKIQIYDFIFNTTIPAYELPILNEDN